MILISIERTIEHYFFSRFPIKSIFFSILKLYFFFFLEGLGARFTADL